MLIGEVARLSGVSARMLRHYESLGLLRPCGRTIAGYREYGADDLRRILHVESLRSLGLSLREITRAVDDPDFAPATLIAELIERTEQRLLREQELLQRLRGVAASDPGQWREVLRIVELLRGLDSPAAAHRQQAALAPTDDGSVPAEALAEAVLTESDANVAGALRWALARADGDVLALVAPALRSDDVAVRRRAVLAVAELTGPGTDETLARALDDPDRQVRRTAALACGARGQAASTNALVDMVVSGDGDVEASEVLGSLAADPAIGTTILHALVTEIDSPRSTSVVRVRVVQALGELPCALAHGTLTRLAGDGDRTVAAIAAALLRSA
ncbi:MerR family DNA-binding transcriptional regulator [Tsukamurella sp. 8F]|uniref:MerR family transcriptional regulator n=1 Tax=unclassified Tsukamurella TaxID=2633480 RepID=UPI0023B9BB60|nr:MULTISPECIES: MerR family transcriptional regulator [unclassified Tsukamurella]MDF0531886.1 MerR family DNA-binding transcriptional regulator [Tsukamurella sp. 8J]MDF0589120.1 MerR family DNA-binding transcriptional regulator [Tsukamurella sp. 8F]